MPPPPLQRWRPPGRWRLASRNGTQETPTHTQAKTRVPSSTAVARWGIHRTRRLEDGGTPTCAVFENRLIRVHCLSITVNASIYSDIILTRKYMSVVVGASFAACEPRVMIIRLRAKGVFKACHACTPVIIRRAAQPYYT